MNIPKALSDLQQIGLTQAQIGAAIGCSQATVSDLLAGKVGTTNPSYKIVTGLQRLLKKHRLASASSAVSQATVEPQH